MSDGSIAKRQKRRNRNTPKFNVAELLHRMTGGYDLTSINGIDSYAALKLISEIGIDMTRWPSEKHFTSWITLAPQNKVTGGRRISSKTPRRLIVPQRYCVCVRYHSPVPTRLLAHSIGVLLIGKVRTKRLRLLPGRSLFWCTRYFPVKSTIKIPVPTPMMSCTGKELLTH